MKILVSYLSFLVLPLMCSKAESSNDYTLEAVEAVEDVEEVDEEVEAIDRLVQLCGVALLGRRQVESLPTTCTLLPEQRRGAEGIPAVQRDGVVEDVEDAHGPESLGSDSIDFHRGLLTDGYIQCLGCTNHSPDALISGTCLSKATASVRACATFS